MNFNVFNFIFDSAKSEVLILYIIIIYDYNICMYVGSKKINKDQNKKYMYCDSVSTYVFESILKCSLS